MVNYNDAVYEKITLLEKTRSQVNKYTELKNIIIHSLLNNNKIMICGNGGSAADAQHFAAELTGRFKKNRPPIAAIAMTTDTSALTAIGNDYGFDHIFSRQIEAIGKNGDVLLLISTSGMSRNLISAAEVARKIGITVACLLGCDGGILIKKSDISLIVDSYDTARIQEIHLFWEHCLCEDIESEFV